MDDNNMDDNKECKKCGHLCHCIEADHEGCKCDGCDCGILND